VDSAVEQGDVVTGFYDPMIAKLIVHAPSRAAGARQLARACESVEVWPVRTNAAFLARVARHPAFGAGAIDTGFIQRHAAELIPDATPAPDIIAAAAAALSAPQGDDPWHALLGFRCNMTPCLQVRVAIGEDTHTVSIDPRQGPASVAMIAGERVLFVRGEAWRFAIPAGAQDGRAETLSDGALYAPMPGRTISVAVRPGQAVRQGQTLLILEAMKMELTLQAPFDGIVTELSVATGDQVSEGVVLARIAKE
jgi:3-methylcrotonyl-CoA carboxylase alpha subunit